LIYILDDGFVTPAYRQAGFAKGRREVSPF
jgi:hypothetical protein